MGVKNSDLADLIATTLEDLPKQEFEVMWIIQSMSSAVFTRTKEWRSMAELRSNVA